MRRGWRRVGLGLLLAAMGAGLLGWQARRPSQAAMPVMASAPRVAAGPATAAPAPASRPEAAIEALAGAASAPSQLKAEAPKEFIDVCGVGRIRRSELERGDDRQEPAWVQALSRQGEQSLSDVVERLDAGSRRQRVAAAVLRGDADAAAQLAASTDDAKAYRMALQACRRDISYRQAYAYQKRVPPAASAASGFVMPQMAAPGPAPNACAALNLDRLALLDPDDAWPWLVRLDDAHAKADDAAVSQALYQVAQRRRLSGNNRMITAAMSEVVGAEPTPGETWALVSAVGTDMASAMQGSLLSIGRPCRAEALRDANRRQLCEQVARRMPDMAAEAMDSRVLHALEERLGLPHSPQALFREDTDRALRGMAEESGRWMDEPTCTNVSSMGRHLLKLAREGELAGMRAFLRSSPASAPR